MSDEKEIKSNPRKGESEVQDGSKVEKVKGNDKDTDNEDDKISGSE